MLKRTLLLLLAASLMGLSPPVQAQGDIYVLDSAEADLDGDRVPERILILSPDSSDPSNVSSKKELRILKRKGDRFQTVHKMPIGARFNTKISPWQFEEPASKLWGLQILPGKPRNRLMVVFTTGSGEFFTVFFNGKSYQVESSGD